MTKKLIPADLGLDPGSGSAEHLYRWLLASVLLGRPIQQSVAAATYRTLIGAGLTSPTSFDRVSREQLRRLLDRGGYVQFDFRMSDTLRSVMRAIATEYGSVHGLVQTSADEAQLTARLTGLSGIGPVTARIFAAQVPATLYASGLGDDDR
ncbi:endonuclease III [Okibacterium sp. HSC-33S16]|uniref:hypothetical protein n=1 Tax=Okibacterium sp. HSC-33S16 TaxID=2910965 RepID=UPI00209E5D0C|nr:hypothetical protein [Okibacterium sp. HSC-33S16]MCP2030976.1 endonuclease III [Okibacterium sp. HSC-33S16]